MGRTQTGAGSHRSHAARPSLFQSASDRGGDAGRPAELHRLLQRDRVRRPHARREVDRRSGGVRGAAAPQRPVTINNGYVMRAWYDITGFDSNRKEDEAGMQASAVQVNALIARECERGIAAWRILLAGFSQGGAVALHTGLRYHERLAGILALSTYLPLAASVGAEAQPANRAVPIFMAHGSEDTVIALPRALMSHQRLEELGYPV